MINFYNNKELTQQVYIITTYLYIFGSLIVIMLTCLIIDQYRLLDEVTGMFFVIIFILSLVTLFGTMLTSSNNIFIKNGFYIVLLITLGILSYNVYKLSVDKNIFFQVILIVGVMFISASVIFNYYYFEEINSWGNYLFFSLLGLITIEIIDILFGSREGFLHRNKLYAWIGTLLFSLFLVYDTQKIKETYNSYKEKGLFKYYAPDYPVQSLKIVLDVVILFSNIVNIKS
jgi:FtsH-binding integral membrane protein